PDSTTENLNFQLMTAFGGRISGRVSPPPAAAEQEKAVLSGLNLDGVLEAGIGADGTFSFGHVAKGSYWIDLYPDFPGLGSFRVGSQDVSEGVVVENADVSGVVITVTAPRRLPRVHGRITGLANARPSSIKVQMTGPIIGTLETSVLEDGSFEFPAATPGMYSL